MLGANVVSDLVASGDTVEGLDVDPRSAEDRLRHAALRIPVHGAELSDFLQLASVIRSVVPDCVVNTSVSRAAEKPALMARVNIMGCVNLLESARLFGISRIVHASSTTAYGSAKRGSERKAPISESDLISFSETFYGTTKQAAEGIGHNYAQHCGVDFIALRFPHIFGAGTTSTGMAIENLIKAAVENRPAVLEHGKSYWGGREDFVYVKDAAAALAAACHAKEIKQRTMNISMGVHYTFEEIVALVQASVNTSLTVKRDRMAAAPYLRGSLPAPFDTTLAYEQLGFEPRFNMNAAISDYAQSIRGR
jgi:nucleoside-diphosphate-sugar epimerase